MIHTLFYPLSEAQYEKLWELQCEFERKRICAEPGCNKKIWIETHGHIDTLYNFCKKHQEEGSKKIMRMLKELKGGLINGR